MADASLAQAILEVLLIENHATLDCRIHVDLEQDVDTAAKIEAERQALDRELESAAQELSALQDSLGELRVKLAATKEANAAAQARLTEAEARAKQAAKRLTQLREEPEYSVVSRQTEVNELKGLISSVALMVSELSE